jgi:hypothetical protein
VLTLDMGVGWAGRQELLGQECDLGTVLPGGGQGQGEVAGLGRLRTGLVGVGLVGAQVEQLGQDVGFAPDPPVAISDVWGGDQFGEAVKMMCLGVPQRIGRCDRLVPLGWCGAATLGAFRPGYQQKTP